MIITQTPVRISFFGGGTDYPAHFNKHGGATLSTTIDKFTTITIHPLTAFSDHRIRVHYSQVESVNHIDEIKHPSARECLRFMGIDNIEIHYVSDLPARTGLGSSSSATVGLLLGLHAYKGNMVSREQVAEEAIYVEQNLIGENVGCQDQVTCAVGGFNVNRFETTGKFHCDPLVISAERRNSLQDRLLLLYTGTQRQAHEVAGEQIWRTEQGELTTCLTKMHKFVEIGHEILCGNNDLRDFGRLLHETWILKRQLSSKIAPKWIDDCYDRALGAGAIGGKLLGAGGGGFLLLFVEPEIRKSVLAALGDLRETPFTFDQTGASVVYYKP